MVNTDTRSDALYQKEAKIYPKSVSGRYARLRMLATVLLLGLYYLLPWLRWDGRQAILFDLPARKFYLFGLTLWPQDFIYLALLLVTAGLSLFFFTALAGRLWCGYACPQTVWTEAFLFIERRIEGDRNQRIKLDRAPWSANKVLRKGLKQTLWVLFALWTGFTFVGYFTPITELAGKLVHFKAGPWESFWTLFYAFATYGNAGFLRSQVCKYMCPYARFQSAMFDNDTLIIAYDEQRGEARGGRSKKADPAALGLGDCIDCTLCVQVCPTGIDIRDGLQYECIACAACIDVCDQVMDKMNYPRGLVHYTTAHASEGRKTRLFRARSIIYGTLLLVLLGGIFLSLEQRVPLRAELIRDRNALYRELPDEMIENVYTLRLINMDRDTHEYRIDITGLDHARLLYDQPLVLQAEENRSVSLRIQAPRHDGAGSRDITLNIQTAERSEMQTEAAGRFFYPLSER